MLLSVETKLIICANSYVENTTKLCWSILCFRFAAAESAAMHDGSAGAAACRCCSSRLL